MGMFANTDWKSAIQAALAGYMSRQSPQVSSAIFGHLQQAQSDKRQESQYQQRRQDQNADWQSHYDYEAAHRAPPQPGEFEQRLVGSGVQPGTPEWTQAMQAAVQNVTDPVIMTWQGPMLRSQVMGGRQQQPPKPLSDEDILRMQGGQTAPSPSGGFPGY